MKISVITAAIIKDYCGISDSDSDTLIANVLMPTAKEYIKSYTGLTEAELDDHEDLTAAYCVLINDMYSQRDYTLSIHRQVSPTVKNILSMYAVNHLG